MNFGNPEDKLCQVCKLFPETQSHLLQCSELVPHLKLLSLNNEMIDEKFVDKSIDKQLQIAKLYIKVLKIRRQILEESKSAI